MDVLVREEGAADVDVFLFKEVNVSFSIVCGVTYSKLSNDSFSVLVVAPYPCIKVSKQQLDDVSWIVVNCHQQ